MLLANSIPFKACAFKNEANFLKHILSDPYTKNAKETPFYALIVDAPNGKKHIALSFEEINGDFLFLDLWFGDLCFEYFNCTISADDLLHEIRQIMAGNRGVITKSNAENGRWIADALFELDDTVDDMYGKPGFEKAKQRIRRESGFIRRLLKIRYRYEIYDWHHAECVIK